MVSNILSLDQCYEGLNSLFCISRVQAEKTTAVAVACILLFGAQLALPMATVAHIAFSCSVITFISEKYLRTENEQNSWFNIHTVNVQAVVGQIAIMLTIQTIAGIVLTLLNIAPPQTVAQLIAQRDIRIIVLATLVAPLAEEIFFRGFVMERIEDSITLFNRHVYTIYPPCVVLDDQESHIRSQIRQSEICHLGQAIIFGAIHMRSSQTKWANAFIFGVTTWFGIVFSKVKECTGALIHPIIAHSIHNGSMVYRLVLFGH